jgi:hypothetical protein
MAIAKLSPKKADTPEWLRCQDTIRRLIRHLGRDSLIYAKSALEYEDNEPEKLNVFWESARRFFDEHEAPKSVSKATTRVVKPEPGEETPAPPVPEVKSEGNHA